MLYILPWRSALLSSSFISTFLLLYFQIFTKLLGNPHLVSNIAFIFPLIGEIVWNCAFSISVFTDFIIPCICELMSKSLEQKDSCGWIRIPSLQNSKSKYINKQHLNLLERVGNWHSSENTWNIVCFGGYLKLKDQVRWTSIWRSQIQWDHEEKQHILQYLVASPTLLICTESINRMICPI